MTSRNVYAAMFTIALSTLAFEITLSRLMSVVTWYSLSFLAISVAMLGMTAGAVTVFLWKKDLPLEDLIKRFQISCVGFGVTVPIAIVAICSLGLSSSNNVNVGFNLALMTFIISLPFYFSGIAVSALLTQYPLPVNRLYTSDLLGASMGCIAVLVGLSTLDTPSFGFLVGFLGVFAAAILNEKNQFKSIVVLTVITVIAISITSTTRVVKPKPVKVDELISSLKGIEGEYWNSFSRIIISKEAVDKPYLWSGHQPFYENMKVPLHYMTIDGLAGTVMNKYQNKEDIEYLKYDVTNIAHFLRPTGDSAVIGVGGGKDVQAALWFGHENVLGVELNPIFVDLLENKYSDFAGIGDNDRVRLVVDEARSYMSHSTEEFTLLQMSLIDTWAATGAGAFSLSENSLYTVEAWQTFLSRLTSDGIYTVSRWYRQENPAEAGRMISLAMATLMENGVEHPAEHIAVVVNKTIATLILAKSPLSEDDMEKLRFHSDELKHEVLIVPGEVPTDPVLASIMASKTVEDLHRASDEATLNVTPSTDQSPYFFNMLKLDRIDELLAEGLDWGSDGGVLAGNLLATLTLLVLTAVLLVLMIPTIVVPLVIHTRRMKSQGMTSTGITFSAASFFGLIGAGFMLVEIALMQRLSVFLGHPVYALGILLFGIIASTGIGSWVSERIAIQTKQAVITLGLVAAASIAVMQFMMNEIVSVLITYAMPIKILAAVLIIFPMGFIMGFFFPTGMTIVKSSSETATAWYWAINGIFGVIFSALAVFFSIYVDITFNFYLGIFFYCLTGFCLAEMLDSASEKLADR